MARQGYAGRWWVSVPRDNWPQDADSLNFIAEQWQEGTGDARQQLVFNGIEMDEKRILSALDHALLSPHEMAAGPEHWIKLTDPVPALFDETTA